jgi:putative transposase
MTRLGTVTLLARKRECGGNGGHETNCPTAPHARQLRYFVCGIPLPARCDQLRGVLYYRFPLSLRMVEELPAARGIDLTYETVRRWSVKSGLGIARRIRSTALARGDKWHLDEMVVTINGMKHWLWRAVDQHGAVLDVLVQSRRDRHAARRLIPQD